MAARPERIVATEAFDQGWYPGNNAVVTQTLSEQGGQTTLSLRVMYESKDARERLRRYAAIYGAVLGDDRMCLCGMLAAEFGTLPEPMRVEMRHFFDENERWLVGVLKQGKREKTLKFTGSPADTAQALIGSLEGAMMIARSYADPRRFKTVTERILVELGA